eukprot:6464102-Amphidinium_carterae.2
MDFGSGGLGFGTAGEVEDNVSEELTPTPSAVSSPRPKRARLDPQVTLGHVALERLQAASSSTAAHGRDDAVTEFVWVELARSEISRLPGIAPLPGRWDLQE